jgi:thioredoxin:protein disulfide reductase
MPPTPAPTRRARGTAASRLLAAAGLLLAALLPGTVLAVDPDDLLPVDQAFPLTVTAPSSDRIEVSWRVAEGYYLYRHRMGAESADAGFTASGPLRLPAGKRYTDEFFGEVETYRQRVTGTLPGRAAAGARTATIRVKFQGCADIGVCYPPQVRTVRVALPVGGRGVAAEAAPTRDPIFGGAVGGGANLLGGGEALPPEQAFRVEAIAGDGNTVLLRMTPARGYYLYRDKTSVALDAGPGISASLPPASAWPPGTPYRDEYFGNTVVYFDQVELAVPVRRAHPRPVQGRLTVGFQGCQDEGICYPPMTRTLAVALPAGAVAAGTSDAPSPPAPLPQAGEGSPASAAEGGAQALGGDGAPNGSLASGAGAGSGGAGGGPGAGIGEPGTGSNAPLAGDGAAVPGAPGGGDAELAEDSRLAAALEGTGRWWVLAGFFGAGLLLAFTPCVLPMIPILSGLIAGASARHGGRLGARRALVLSSIYVLASALVFTAAGVVAGLVGANLQVAFQTPWVIVAFAGLFVALALAMFGLYELQVPASLRARLGELADRQRGGSWAGVAAMGALSALIVGPCVAPPLAAAVLYIGQTRDPVFGGMALFLLAIGMGLPLLAFGMAAGRGLPTSGPWMIAVQRVFGFVFIGLAIWMLSRVLPGPAALSLWGLLALAAAAWAMGLARPETAPRGRLAARFAALLLAVAGAAQLLGALAGGNDPLRPLANVTGAPAPKLEFRMIKSAADVEREVAAAQAAGRPLLFDFYADWCVSCKEMDKYTFSEPAVQAALADFVLLKADVTANDALDQELMRRHGIIGPPATLFFVDGVERRALRLVGFEPAGKFAERVGRAAPAAVATSADTAP